MEDFSSVIHVNMSYVMCNIYDAFSCHMDDDLWGFLLRAFPMFSVILVYCI